MKPSRVVQCAIVGVVVALVCVSARSPDFSGDDKEIRASIDAYLADPLKASDEVCASIVDFADRSNTVEIVIDEQLAPWMHAVLSAKAYEGEAALHVAYIAGNIRSQLDSGVTHSDDYSGLVQVLRTYRMLKAADAERYANADCDKLLAQQARGELLTRCASVEKKRSDKKK